MDYSIEELVQLIQNWACERNIITGQSTTDGRLLPTFKWPENGGDLIGQARKLQEEANEVLEAAAKITQAFNMGTGNFYPYPELQEHLLDNALDELMDGVGDTLVVLAIICAGQGLDLRECLKYAYYQIKDRKGRMINGKFVKEENLPEKVNPPGY